MKIANSKSGSVGWMLRYNEDKLEAGSAQLIGGNISTTTTEDYERILNHYAFQRKTETLQIGSFT